MTKVAKTFNLICVGLQLIVFLSQITNPTDPDQILLCHYEERGTFDQKQSFSCEFSGSKQHQNHIRTLFCTPKIISDI